MKENVKDTAYDKAMIRVKRIKGFYRHVFIYLIFLLLWFVFAIDLLSFLGNMLRVPEHGFPTWIDINMWLNPLIWGAVILLHGVFVFGPQHALFRKWEAKKIQELIEDEGVETTNRYE